MCFLMNDDFGSDGMIGWELKSYGTNKWLYDEICRWFGEIHRRLSFIFGLMYELCQNLECKFWDVLIG